MTARNRRRLRLVLLAGLTLPVLGAGTCVTLLRESVVTGVVDATTPLVVEYLEEKWGLASALPAGAASRKNDGAPGVTDKAAPGVARAAGRVAERGSARGT